VYQVVSPAFSVLGCLFWIDFPCCSIFCFCY